MQQPSASTKQPLSHAIGATTLAAILGASCGMLMAWIAPSDEFSWLGLALIPLWLLLEIFFESAVAVLGFRARAVRIASAGALLAGFYAAWFALRGFAA